MPNRVGGMPVATEVDALDIEVRGDKYFVAGGNPQDGTVIANAPRNQFAGADLSRGSGGSPGEAAEEFSFSFGHEENVS